MKDFLLDAAYKVLKGSLLLEMAIAKKEYSDKVFQYLPRIIEHYMYIKCAPHSPDVRHWKNEIITFLLPIARSKYKHTKKYPTQKDFMSHVENSGHEYTPEGFEDIYRMVSHIEKLPMGDFKKISSDFVHFIQHIGSKIEHGQLITISDIL